MLKNNKRSLQVTAIAVTVTLLLAGASGQAAAKAKKIKINHKKMTLAVGQKRALKVKNTKKKVKWISKNKKVAIVNKKGIVTAKKKGSAKIVARIGKKKYTCRVTVKPNKKRAKIKSTKKPTYTMRPIASKVPVVSQKPTIVPTATVNPTPTPIPLPTVKPTPVPDEGWQTGKVSGSEEDYNKYFALNMKDYTKKQKGTVLGTIESITYPSKVVGAEREAYVYLPPQYDSSKKYPVLYMIHGIGCERGQWVGMSLKNILSNMICRGEVAPFVAVIPSVVPKDGVSSNTLGPENIGAFTMFEQEFLQDLEPYILENFAVSSDGKDTGVRGLSMGGMEALHLGFAIKDHFNYIGSFSAAPTLDQSILNTNGWKNVPETVLLCSGTADTTIGDNPYNYHKTLEENKVDHIWYMYPNGTHEEKVWQNGLVNFLLRSYR